MTLINTRLLPLLSVLTLMLLCGPAQAAKRFYLAGYMGMNIYPELEYKHTTQNFEGDMEFDKGRDISGALGFRLTPNLRLEAELSDLRAEISGLTVNGNFAETGGSITSQMAMLNMYYDFDMNLKNLRPFGGGGVGYAWHQGDIDSILGFGTDISGESSGMVWNIGGGFRYPIGKDLALITAYRYIDGQDVKVDDFEIDYGAHEFRLGISWNLPFE
jgi:opacity protein-like surface antigen